MVVKSIIKLIKSLQQKKHRIEHQLFVVEGRKSVNELLNSSFELYGLYVTEDLEEEYQSHQANLVSAKELSQMSSLKTPSGVLAVFHIPDQKELNKDEWILALDDISDPGNLGTIIRLCDWFGIKQLYCSNHTVDCYNPKTLQATMGSISRVELFYGDLDSFLSKTDLPVYGSFMDGASIYQSKLPEKGILIMGNEANGIGDSISSKVSHRISIPTFGNSKTESLNVAMATSILLSELRRDSEET